MDLNIPEDEYEIFLLEYKEILNTLSSVSVDISKMEPGKALKELIALSVPLNSMLGMAEFMPSRDLIDLSRLLTKFLDMLIIKAIKWDKTYGALMTECASAFGRIYEHFKNRDINSIDEKQLIVRLSEMLRQFGHGKASIFELDSDEEELLINEMNLQIDNFSLSVEGLKKNSKDEKLIFEAYRAAHTIRGLAASINFSELAQLAAETEQLLFVAKEGKLVLSADIFICLDEVKKSFIRMLDSVINNKKSIYPIKGMIDKLKGFSFEGVAEPKETVIVESRQIEITKDIKEKLKNMMSLRRKLFDINVIFYKDYEMGSVRCLQIINTLEEKGSIIKSIPSKEEILLNNKKYYNIDILYMVDSMSASIIETKIKVNEEMQIVKIAERKVEL